MRANKLALNNQKIQVMILNKNPYQISPIDISPEPKNIKNQESLKFLGIKIA